MGGIRKSSLSKYKQDCLVEHFISRTTARKTTGLWGVNRKTAALYFLLLSKIIAYELEPAGEVMFGGKIEVDENYFSGSHKGKRGYGTAGKLPLFGLSKRGGKLYAEIIPNSYAATLIPIIERKVVPESIF
jgi:transposase